MNISDNLRKYRKIRRMTLKELSANSNISISFISDIEHGRKKPSFQNAKRLADCLNMDVKLLLDKDKENLMRYRGLLLIYMSKNPLFSFWGYFTAPFLVIILIHVIINLNFVFELLKKMNNTREIIL